MGGNVGLTGLPPRRWPGMLKGVVLYPEYRKRFFTTKRRELRMFFKYDAYPYYEKYGMAFAALGVIWWVGHSRFSAKLLRLPTEDVNELLKHDVWVAERNEINLRKDQASKMMADSTYIQKRNAPVE